MLALVEQKPREERICEGHLIVLSGSTVCPHPDLCDRGGDESHEDYVRRHARDHNLGDFSDFEDAERNLGLWCLYYFHKYLIGNPTLCPYPYWEIHEFVANWEFADEDLEAQLWSDLNPLPWDKATYRLLPAAQRKPGEYRRLKNVEIPRGCQKTSTVSKAWVTWEHLRQYFILGNIYFRVIITSATTTLTRGVIGAIKAVWIGNHAILRLFGTTVQTTKGPKRIGIYGRRDENSLTLRWTAVPDNATGLTAFSVLYGGLNTETTGQRADVYVVDDGSTKKNSRTAAQREKVKEDFVEFLKQCDQSGRMIVCDTRKHLNDFAGEIKKAHWAKQFHILHRPVEWVDPVTGDEVLYYPVDGQGKERYSRRILDQIHALSAERDYWSEMMNRPMDPSRSVFKREDFQLIPREKCPIEIRFGLGGVSTEAERHELESSRRRVQAFLHIDPAGKEEASVKGDKTAMIGIRFDYYSNLYVVLIRGGQWDSSGVWDTVVASAAYVQPEIIDYEMPASELHIRSSFEAWQAQKSIALGRPLSLPMLFAHMPKVGKASRIEQMATITKARKFYILADAGTPEDIREFIEQFANYPMAEHDDFPDACSRVLRFVGVPNIVEAREAERTKEQMRTDEDGVTKVRMEHLIASMAGRSRTAQPWGLRGGVR